MTDWQRGSRIPGFYNLDLAERLAERSRRSALTPEELEALNGLGGLALEQADHMIENVVGTYSLPLGIALNCMVNGQDVLVPMVVEEPSIVAGASFMARLARPCKGCKSSKFLRDPVRAANRANSFGTL